MFFITAELGSNDSDWTLLPEEIQHLKDGIQSKQQEMDQRSQRVIDRILEISQVKIPMNFYPY